MDVECCDEKSVSRRVQFEAKCRETTRPYARYESVIAITRFQTGVCWHFHFLKDEVLKIELDASVFSANLRLRV